MIQYLKKTIIYVVMCVFLVAGVTGCGKSESPSIEEASIKLEEAESAYSNGNYKEAILAAESAVEINPELFKAYEVIANSYEKLEDYGSVKAVADIGKDIANEVSNTEYSEKFDSIISNAEFKIEEIARIAKEAEEEEKAKEEERKSGLSENPLIKEGQLCLYGLEGTEVDYNKAYELFTKALDEGDEDANFYVGLMYDWYCVPEEDYNKALEYYEKNPEDTKSQIAKAYILYNGDAGEREVEAAKAIAKELEADGVEDANALLGYMAYIEADYENALKYLTKEVESGREKCFAGSSMYILSMLYCGYDAPELANDIDKANELSKQAVEIGCTAAAYDYAFTLELEGKSEEALDMLKWGAELGENSCQFELGEIYYAGDGGLISCVNATDYAEAFKWYMMSAENGDPDAMDQVGYLYYIGYGVEEDMDKAHKWYKKAAELGNEDAKEMLSIVWPQSSEPQGIDKNELR